MSRKASARRGARLTDRQVSLLLAGRTPREDASLAELAALVRSTRGHYLEAPRPAVGERHEAMIAAAASGLAVQGREAEARAAAPHRANRLGGARPARPRLVALLAASALAAALAWVLAEANGGGGARRAERAGTQPAPERVAAAPPDGAGSQRQAGAGSQRRQAGARQAGGGLPRSVDAPSGAARPATPSPQPDSAVEPVPEAPSSTRPAPAPPAVGGAGPRAELEGPLDSEPPADLGYGGPHPNPTPFKEPLDTEPLIAPPSESEPAPITPPELR
jgi:hypothetical protein